MEKEDRRGERDKNGGRDAKEGKRKIIGKSDREGGREGRPSCSISGPASPRRLTKW